MTMCALTAACCSAERMLTVMSFNLRHGLGMDGPDSWPHRKDILVQAIQRQDPDVLGTQECLDFQAKYIAEKLPDYGWVGLGRDKGGKGEMAAVFYKKNVLNPLESGHFWLSETPEVPASNSWDSSVTRIVTWIKFQHIPTGMTFMHFNTHFDHKGPEARLHSAELLVKKFAAIDAKIPIILTGDFNTDAESSAPWKALIDSGMQDSRQKAEKVEGPMTSWSAFKAPDPNAKTRIDWILFRGDLRPVYSEISPWNSEGHYPSDHFPTITKFILPSH
jgi:endonuclease/exonuclease/phosphatase family metal-dependent hydrolase